MITIKIGSFEVDTRAGIFVRLPWIGAGHYGAFGWVWDWWSELKRIEG